MNLESKQQEKIRQYLLGRVPEDELATLDERLITDAGFYEELLIVEDELIDQYLSDELSAEERESFETHFLLTPERRQKLSFSRGFNNYLNVPEQIPDKELDPEPVIEGQKEVPEPPPKKWYSSFLPIQNPILAYSFMAAVVLIVAGVSWLALKNLNNRSAQESGPVYAVALTSGVTRGSGSENKISFPPGTGTVELRPELRTDDYAGYRAMLLGGDGSEIWRGENLQSKVESGSRFIVVAVPARLLSPGDYLLRVTGLRPDGKSEDLPSYRFRVLR